MTTEQPLFLKDTYKLCNHVSRALAAVARAFVTKTVVVVVVGHPSSGWSMLDHCNARIDRWAVWESNERTNVVVFLLLIIRLGFISLEMSDRSWIERAGNCFGRVD